MNEPRRCGKCGKEFDEYEGGLYLDQKMSYGSDFDGSFVKTQLCCKCSDKLIRSCKLQVIFDDPPTN